MSRRFAFAAVFACSLSVFAISAQEDPIATANRAEWRKVSETLEREGDADSLLTAALFRHVALKDSAGTIALLDRSLELSPRRSEVAWLALQFCASAPPCQSGPRAAVLAELDPRNAVVHAFALAEARKANDVAAADRALAAMGNAAYFDIYWSRLIARSVDALVRPRGETQQPLLALPEALPQMLGLLAGLAIPPFSAMGQTCRADQLQRAELEEHCRKLAAVLHNGDAVITQGLGRNIGLRVWPADSADAAMYRASSRTADYLSESIGHLEESVRESETEARRMLELFRANRREVDVFRQWLTEFGIPPEPPADWVSARASAIETRNQ